MAKKALVFGLGLLGGGVATTNWLVKHGYQVTVTDLKTEKQLRPSLRRIKGKVKLALGGHSEEDIKANDLIVVNPDVSPENKFIQLARKLSKEVVNEAVLFYSFWNKKTVGVTGTRGKTTTAHWVNHFLRSSCSSLVAGNSYTRPLLSALDKQNHYDFAVTELPSFLLEIFDGAQKAPDIAVITNLSQDHLNRHGTMEEYAKVKANIFSAVDGPASSGKKQTARQRLILNVDNQWTEFFLKQKPHSRVWFFSLHKLSPSQSGLFYRGGKIFFLADGKTKAVLAAADFIKERGEHNLQNLLASALAAHLAGVSWLQISARIATLPVVEYREEVIFDNGKLKIINDTTATSPDGGIAAIKRFCDKNCLLITGGTDRQLDFGSWAKIVFKYLRPEQLIFLKGSATDKMLFFMNGQIKSEQLCDTLEQCFDLALAQAQKLSAATIVFSPAAKSFEKFKNEYDRGRKFNRLVKKRLTQE